jgi:hypothetical protein
MKLTRGLMAVVLSLVGCAYDGSGTLFDDLEKVGITVSGRKVLRDNHRFISRGVIFEGFQFPKDAMDACQPAPGGTKDQDFCDRHLAAMEYLLRREALALAVKHWKVNTVRFNVNQALLDPASTLYDKKDENKKQWGVKYLNLLENAVQVARAKKLVVIIALFSGRLDRADNVYVDGKSLNELNGASPMATARTKRAMETLAKTFRGDKEVLLEVFNEPYGTDPIYVLGGSKDGENYVGVKQIVRAARDAGVRTPIIVQGNNAKITDYLINNLGDDNIIYSSHPFLKEGDPNRGLSLFNQEFGNAADQVPVILTAWDATPTEKKKKDPITNEVETTNTWCTKSWYKFHLPEVFIQYVRNRNLGLTGFAFDVPGSITQDFRKFADQPTSFGAGCDDGGHAGELVQGLFKNYENRGDDKATEKTVEGPDDDEVLDGTVTPDGHPTYDSDNEVWRAYFGPSTFQRLPPSDPESMRLHPAVFDHKFYLQRYPDLAAAAAASPMTNRDFAEKHWKDNGIKEGRMGSPTWDPIYYAAIHPDVAAAFGTNYYSMLNHFLNGGRQAGYRASPTFDPAYYYNRYGDLQSAIGWNPAALLDHFIAYGLNEGRQASAELAPAWYLGTSPGVEASLEKANYHGAIIHFFKYGQPAGWPGSHP